MNRLSLVRWSSPFRRASKPPPRDLKEKAAGTAGARVGGGLARGQLGLSRGRRSIAMQGRGILISVRTQEASSMEGSPHAILTAAALLGWATHAYSEGPSWLAPPPLPKRSGSQAGTGRSEGEASLFLSGNQKAPNLGSGSPFVRDKPECGCVADQAGHTKMELNSLRKKPRWEREGGDISAGLQEQEGRRGGGEHRPQGQALDSCALTMQRHWGCWCYHRPP